MYTQYAQVDAGLTGTQKEARRSTMELCVFLGKVAMRLAATPPSPDPPAGDSAAARCKINLWAGMGSSSPRPMPYDICVPVAASMNCLRDPDVGQRIAYTMVMEVRNWLYTQLEFLDVDVGDLMQYHIKHFAAVAATEMEQRYRCDRVDIEISAIIQPCWPPMTVLRNLNPSDLIVLPLLVIDDVSPKPPVERRLKTLKYGSDCGAINSCCSVCLDDFEEEEKLKMAACRHTFHEGCIFRWLKKASTCPLCRTDL